MAQTWTDTTYKLDGTEMTILTTHEGFNQVSLYVPGYSLDGRGFSVYFSVDHIELLEDLLDKLKQIDRINTSETTIQPIEATVVPLEKTAKLVYAAR